MAFQFVHLETYARKPDAQGRSVGWVLDEAARKPGSCPHVAVPAEPVVLHGVPIGDVRRIHDEACERTQVTLSTGKTRALRKDQKTLMTVVASHPAGAGQVRTDPRVGADVAAWELRTIQWLRDRYGDGLISVVRHADEPHAHIHAYVLPPGLRAMALHPGAVAKRAVMDGGPVDGEDSKALNRRGDAAYKAAMREWQDSYWNAVGLPSGLTRLGPGRRRLSRADWQAEKSAAAAVKIATEKAAILDQQAQAFIRSTKVKGTVFLDRVREEAEAMVTAAQERSDAARRLQDAALEQERTARAVLSRAKSQSDRILMAARREASRVSSWGGRVRSLWAGMRRSSIEAAARRAATQAIADERARGDDARRRHLEEAVRRRDAELRARSATEAAQVTARERDQARRELVAMRPTSPVPDAGRRRGR